MSANDVPPLQAGLELSALRESLYLPDDVSQICASSYLLLAIRLSVAVLFLSYSIHGLFPGLVESTRGYAFVLTLWPEQSGRALFGLLGIGGAGLVLGLRSRLLLGVSIPLLALMAAFSASTETFGWERWMMVFAVNLMAYPLLRFGGGRWALLRGGWRIPG